MTFAGDEELEMTRAQEHAITARLLSPDPHERQEVLHELSNDDFVAQQAALNALDEAVVENRDAVAEHRDKDLIDSPLSCAIAAVHTLRVYDADDTLLSIVGYRDASPRRSGGVGGGESFYPAAAALVAIRVDTGKVVDAFPWEAESDREIRLLAWVLARRTGSVKAATALLENSRDQPGVARAFELLEHVEATDDLLRHTTAEK